MKAITLHQPYATLIAIGAKRFETRDWRPSPLLMRQRIAIHAGMRPVGKVGRDDEDFAAALGAEWWNAIPLGAVVCTAVLAGAYQCGSPATGGQVRIAQRAPGSAVIDRITPDPFGDYHEGRWAWLLAEVEAFNPARPAKGMQGFWDWRVAA